MPSLLHSRTEATAEPPEEAADAELVRLAQGAPRAFAALYLRYRIRS